MIVGPGSRAGQGRGVLTPATYGRILWAGSTTTISYAPTIAGAFVPDTLLVFPPSDRDILYELEGFLAWATNSGQNMRTNIFFDGVSLLTGEVNWFGQGDGASHSHPRGLKTVPGDGQQHTAQLHTSSSGGSGTLSNTCYARVLVATPVMP